MPTDGPARVGTEHALISLTHQREATTCGWHQALCQIISQARKEHPDARCSRISRLQGYTGEAGGVDLHHAVIVSFKLKGLWYRGLIRMHIQRPGPRPELSRGIIPQALLHALQDVPQLHRCRQHCHIASTAGILEQNTHASVQQYLGCAVQREAASTIAEIVARGYGRL